MWQLPQWRERIGATCAVNVRAGLAAGFAAGWAAATGLAAPAAGASLSMGLPAGFPAAALEDEAFAVPAFAAPFLSGAREMPLTSAPSSSRSFRSDRQRSQRLRRPAVGAVPSAANASIACDASATRAAAFPGLPSSSSFFPASRVSRISLRALTAAPEAGSAAAAGPTPSTAARQITARDMRASIAFAREVNMVAIDTVNMRLSRLSFIGHPQRSTSIPAQMPQPRRQGRGSHKHRSPGGKA